MKVLLDEDPPHKLRQNLPGHDVSTVSYMGWSGLKNGELLRTAEAADFEVFLTGDQKLSYQQNLKERLIGIVTLSAQEWPIIKSHLPAIAAAVDAALPGSFQSVECGSFRR
ncbi:DUF5615 family PIN-like protein [Granulicella mallensis]|uniref:Uncharacterized protein n=1 Tax=Granulicella mallensis (strain ATCC BAA-1857 / DSM 23137 / MP5ACTX8) TaxID=682795 RepID=G8NY29_GRAMM|nr:DUF5615 family PIN-like protein [Granulicella mallensis]AEU35617.1 hypothetical protein AciX8_1274 [Granulicella mallensis MP5ACTX8]